MLDSAPIAMTPLANTNRATSGVASPKTRAINEGKKVLWGVPRKGLTLDYMPGCGLYEGAKQVQIGIVAKRIGLSVDAIRFYERNPLVFWAAVAAGRFVRRSESRQR